MFNEDKGGGKMNVLLILVKSMELVSIRPHASATGRVWQMFRSLSATSPVSVVRGCIEKPF